MTTGPALEFLANLVEWAFAGSEHLPAWRAFVSEVEVEGWLDPLDEHDGYVVACDLIDDLGTNPDGSHFLRWRAEMIRDTGVEMDDPALAAAVLEAVAASICKAAPSGIDA